MPRVLHVISSLDPTRGGTTAAILAMARSQRDAGISVSIAQTFSPGEDLSLAESLPQEGISVQSIGPCASFLSRHPLIKPTLRQLIADHDLVHIHALWEEIQHRAAKEARRAGKPYIFMPHGMLDPWSLRQGKLKKSVYLALRLRNDLNRASALAFTDESERELTAPLNLRPPAIVEPLMLDLRDFESLPPRGRLVEKFPALAGKRVVLFMSRLHPKKGLDLLIPAFARANLPDAMLVLAGPCDAEYRLVLDELIARESLRDRVVFAGMLKGTARAEALVDASVFVLPSYQENFGIVVIESLAAGTPVIISDQVGIHRMITAAECGLVVRTDVESVRVGLEKMLTDEGLRQRASTNARPFVGSTFDNAAIARRWGDHYKRLLR